MKKPKKKDQKRKRKKRAFLLQGMKHVVEDLLRRGNPVRHPLILDRQKIPGFIAL
jgi:hypothetical protein